MKDQDEVFDAGCFFALVMFPRVNAEKMISHLCIIAMCPEPERSTAIEHVACSLIFPCLH